VGTLLISLNSIASKSRSATGIPRSALALGRATLNYSSLQVFASRSWCNGT